MIRLSVYRPDQRHVTRKEIQEIDRRAIEEFCIPQNSLMENAGLAVVEQAVKMVASGARISIVCGKGNNGGDGLVAARVLRGQGYDVSVVKPDSDDAIDGDLVIDAILGTGLSREVRGPALERINQINAFGNVLAVDLPSGMDADTGKPLGAAVKAKVTVTMGLPKIGFREAGALTGEIFVAEIGFPPQLL